VTFCQAALFDDAWEVQMDSFFHPDMLTFMMDIRFNNNREFMNENRGTYYRLMRDPYYRLIDAMAPAMKKIDDLMEVRPAKCLSRIFRDTRYSHDKSPYRNHHWVTFRRQGEPRELSVMYWFEIRLEAVSWGLGYWGANRPALDILRQRMVANPREISSLLPILKKHGFVLEGSQYKRRAVPGNLPPALAPWYLKRELYLTKTGVQPEWVFQPGLDKRLVKDFTALAPVYRLLRGCHELVNAENML